VSQTPTFVFADHVDWVQKLTSYTVTWPTGRSGGTTKDDFTITNGSLVFSGPYGTTGNHVWTFKADGYEDVVITVNVILAP
jgi:hypothetical protein